MARRQTGVLNGLPMDRAEAGSIARRQTGVLNGHPMDPALQASFERKVQFLTAVSPGVRSSRGAIVPP